MKISSFRAGLHPLFDTENMLPAQHALEVAMSGKRVREYLYPPTEGGSDDNDKRAKRALYKAIPAAFYSRSAAANARWEDPDPSSVVGEVTIRCSRCGFHTLRCATRWGLDTMSTVHGTKKIAELYITTRCVVCESRNLFSCAVREFVAQAAGSFSALNYKGGGAATIVFDKQWTGGYYEASPAKAYARFQEK